MSTLVFFFIKKHLFTFILCVWMFCLNPVSTEVLNVCPQAWMVYYFYSGYSTESSIIVRTKQNGDMCPL